MTKKRLFFLVLSAGFLLTCKNHYVMELLKAPSELIAINVTAYSGSTLLEGGVAFEPGFAQAVREYTVYIPDETTHFVIKPQFNGKGTVLCLNYDRDDNTGPENLGFRIAPDKNELELILTVERENLAVSEYRLNVMRAGNVPVPKGIVLSVEPGIGSFFLGRGVVPELSVSANEPEGGGVLSYQWYRNYDNNNRSGTRIEGATGASYRLSETEVSRAETVYYYVEITNNVNGKTGSMESMTRPVTFIDKEQSLNIKSRDMLPIPGGTVPEKIDDVDVPWNSGNVYSSWGNIDWERLDFVPDYLLPWETAGFSMAKYPVTWELWKLVFDFAEAGGYHFASIGNQGAEDDIDFPNFSTKTNPRPVGNKLHPVTVVSWNDCVVWCNAYSEMEGLEPVYRDIRGNILRDARGSVSNIVDGGKMAGKNGYRLPNIAEWEYATRGGNPNEPLWNDAYVSSPFPVLSLPGYYKLDGEEYIYAWTPKTKTVEVGSMEPFNGLYDMGGLVAEWGWDKYLNYTSKDVMRHIFNGDFMSIYGPFMAMAEPTQGLAGWSEYTSFKVYMGFRVIRDLEPGVTP